MDRVIRYIRETYEPLSVILYGSYASGTNDQNSDFDAVVITKDHAQYHDTSFVGDIQLDVFVYPADYFDGAYPCEEFMRIFDGQIITDTDDLGKKLRDSVLTYLENRPQKSPEEIKADVDWCLKMLERAKRGDAEGAFRFHWLLVDSLEIFCDIMHHPYFGPKKSLKWMEEAHPDAFEIYKRALRDYTTDSLEKWVGYIKNTNGAPS